MVSIEQALDIARQQEIETTVKEVSLGESSGYYLAEDIHSPFDLPSFDNSAMDGYAVSGISESYRIVGEIPAGKSAAYTLQPGEAVRIFTGAKVPENATAVVMQEKTTVDDSTLHVEGTINEGQHIRNKGNELALGQMVFTRGQYISPATVGLVGSLGINRVKVFQKPDIRIISTGSELVPPGNPKREAQIYESNSYALDSALNRFGFNCREKVQIEDDFSAIQTGIGDFLDRSDVLLLSGGISVGDYDYVGKALAGNDVTELYYRVFQKPGKPLFFGRKRNTFVFALPGNPASSLTCFYIHVLPFLQKFSGAREYGLQKIWIPVSHDYENRSDRPVFLKAKKEDQTVSILNRQSSSMIHSMALGNALAFLDADQIVKKGEMVECILL